MNNNTNQLTVYEESKRPTLIFIKILFLDISSDNNGSGQSQTMATRETQPFFSISGRTGESENDPDPGSELTTAVTFDGSVP